MFASYHQTRLAKTAAWLFIEVWREVWVGRNKKSGYISAAPGGWVMTKRVALADLTVSASNVEFSFLVLSYSVTDIYGSSLSLRDSGCSVCSFAFHLPPYCVTSDPDGRG